MNKARPETLDLNLSGQKHMVGPNYSLLHRAVTADKLGAVFYDCPHSKTTLANNKPGHQTLL